MDKEKVINDLQDAVNDDWMWRHADYYAKAMENALALLKEQDAEIERLRGIAKNGNGFIEKCDSRTAQMFSH